MTFEQIKTQDKAYILPTYGRVDAALKALSDTYETIIPKRTTNEGHTDAAIITQLAEKLMERFSGSTVVLTLGGEGSVCIAADSRFTQSAFPVPVADTTAAGDTYTGFFIGGLLQGKTEREAMREASAAAAIACSRAGAAPSIPSREEVQQFLAAITLP